MRQIRYRAYYKPEKRMIYDIQNEFEERIELGMDCFSDYLNNDDFVVEQDTGLKDKNGKEICEGDILWWEHFYEMTGENIETTAKVYWEEKDASFVVGDWFESLGHLVEEDEIEVISNIHENPELLEGK